MTFRPFFVLGLVLAVASGCQPNQVMVEPKGTHASSEAQVPANPEPKPTHTSPRVEPKKLNAADVADAVKEQNKAQAQASQVSVAQPGSNGWIPAKVEVSKFGSMLDDSVKTWSGVAGTFDMTLQNTEVRGQQLGKFLIDSKSLYRIEYVDVEDPTGPNIMRADGKQKLILNGKQPAKKTQVGQKGQPLEVDKFYHLFTRQIFETYTEGRPTWAPILSSLQRQGYDITLESKNLETGGVMRPFYRLIARKPGQGLNAFEARFDGIRLVPLTMKMNATSPQGKPIKAEWRAIWNFNQKVKDQIIAKAQ